MRRGRDLFPVVAAVLVVAGLVAFSASSTGSIIRDSERLRVADRLMQARSVGDQLDSRITTVSNYLSANFGRAAFRLTPDDPSDRALLEAFRFEEGAITLTSFQGTRLNAVPGREPPPYASHAAYADVAARMTLGTPMAGVARFEWRAMAGISGYARRDALPPGIVTLWTSLTDEASPLRISAPLKRSRADGITGVLVVDQYNLIVGGDDPDRIGMQAPGPSLGRDLTTTGSARYDDRGTERIVAYAPVGSTGFRVLLIEDVRDFYGTVQQDRRRSHLTSLAVLAAAAAGLVVLAHRRQRMVSANERRLAALLGNAADAVLVVRNGRIAYASPGATRVLGRSPDALLGSPAADLAAGAGDSNPVLDVCALATAAEGETVVTQAWFDTPGGERHWVSVSAVDLRSDPTVQGVILTCHDATEQRLLHEQVAHQAGHDSLTGLPNRMLFTDRLEAALRRRHRVGHAGVLFLDLDRLKPVNDELGHEAGDIVLREVGSRLARTVRDGDTVARMGGDEFAVVVQDAGSPDDFAELARRLIDAVGQPIALPSQSVRVGVSVGYAVAGRDDRDADALLRHADLAMYAAKQEGGDRVHGHGQDRRDVGAGSC